MRTDHLRWVLKVGDGGVIQAVMITWNLSIFSHAQRSDHRELSCSVNVGAPITKTGRNNYLLKLELTTYSLVNNNL